MKDLTFLIGSGHGGMLRGVYQTDPKIGKFYRFPDGQTSYEGVINRLIKKQVMEYLTQGGFRAVDVCPTEADLSLYTRCAIINSLCNEFGAHKCLLIDLHSNAGGGRGFEIFTTIGKTQSDVYATIFASIFRKFFPGIPVREDQSDGDPDKESKFYMLVNSSCPAILTEFLFFDNAEDWFLLKNPATHKLYAQMILNFVKQVTT